MINILQRAPAAVLHTYPQLVPAEVATVVRHNVAVLAVPHHENLLLDHRKVITRLQLDDLDGSQFVGLEISGLQKDFGG